MCKQVRNWNKRLLLTDETRQKHQWTMETTWIYWRGLRRRLQHPETMTGLVVITNRSVIIWCLRSHKKFTPSVTEAEYSEITEVCCEILFVGAIVLFMRFVDKYPITIHVDNIVYMLPSENTSVYQQTKHIEVHHHFIHD